MVLFWASIVRFCARGSVWYAHQTNNNSFFRGVSLLGGAPIILAVIGVCLALSWHIAPLNHTAEPKTLPVPIALRSVAIPNPVVANTHTNLLDFRISDRVLDDYNAAFSAQAKGDWAAADAQMRGLKDDTLMGALLAQRYLHEGYASRYDELAAWLRRYRDMPEAARIHALAVRKSPVSASVPEVVHARAVLRGYGNRDGMRGESMPPRFKDGLNAWAAGHYAQAAIAFNDVAAHSDRLSGWNQATAHFWAYRASDKLNQSSQAKVHLAKAAAHPFTFYGLLAEEISGESKNLSSHLPRLEEDVVALPAIKRAAYYSAMGKTRAAEDEIRHLYALAPDGIKPQLLTITSELNLPGLQMRMAQDMNPTAEEAGAAAFPTPGWVPEYDLSGDAALLFAIARQESSFDPSATNHDSGATGLLQLMPNTARYVISQYRLNEVERTQTSANGMPLYSVARLNDPVVNMVIGQQYLNYLSEKDYIGGNLVQLLAAYNAGPGNLLEWQKELGHVKDPLLFVELIPFKETRHYVKQVMCNYMVYDEIMDGSSRQAAALVDGKWPKVQPSAPRYAALEPRLTASRN